MVTDLCYIKSDSKWMFLYKWACYDHFWPFFAICIFIFHKNEVQTVILRCLTCIYLNWFKGYKQNAKNAKTPKMQNWHNWWIHAITFSSIYKHFYEYSNESLRYRYLICLILKLLAWQIWDIKSEFLKKSIIEPQ